MDALSATIFGSRQAIHRKQDEFFSVILSIYIKPTLRPFDQTLPMAAHASDWGQFIESTPLGGQTVHHGDDVCGGRCVVVRRIIHTIPTVGNLRVGSFLLLLGDYW